MTNVRQEEEFAALRATIRERGTVRVLLLPATIALWAGTAVATTAALTIPIASLVPLLVLTAGFEAIFALHVNVERIGRYVQVFLEPDGGWEHVAMAYGQRFPSGGSDPLFSGVFLMATALNYIPVALTGRIPELVGFGALHAILILFVATARRRAGRQRALDRDRFQSLKDAATDRGSN